MKWFVRGDLDGFFGLFIDNLLQIMLIVVLGGAVCGLPAELIVGRILPGAALSILVGNLFYAWQAMRLADATGRSDVTALPYGINTPSLIAYIFVVMGPVYQQTRDAELAWRIGLFACLGSGLVEVAGAFVGEWLRKQTPRAALLSTLAGIAITFISMGFILQIFASPAVAIVPMFLILIAYAARIRFPVGLPGGLLAVGIGVATAWGLRMAGLGGFQPPAATAELGFHLPTPVIGELLALFTDPRAWAYLPVILPMGLLNVIGSLQNLESAEAAGDRYPTRSSLLANGLGTCVAAFFGSAFPTTIYIGHPGWKSLGARAGYSILNGVVIALLCSCGAVLVVLRFVPIEATLGILLWIGIVIMAQAFDAVPRRHMLAVAFGLIPSLGAWGFLVLDTAVRVSGGSLAEVAPKFGGDLYVHGLFALNQGFMLTATTLTAVLVHIIDRRFFSAAAWMAATALLAAFGVIHGYDLGPTGLVNRYGWLAAPDFAAAYAATALMLLVTGIFGGVRKLTADDDAHRAG